MTEEQRRLVQIANVLLRAYRRMNKLFLVKEQGRLRLRKSYSCESDLVAIVYGEDDVDFVEKKQ